MKIQNFQRENLTRDAMTLIDELCTWGCLPEHQQRRGSRGAWDPHGALGGLQRVLSGLTHGPGASAELRARPRGSGPSAGPHAPGRDPADRHPGPSKHPVTAGASGSWPRAPSCLPSRILHLDPRSLLHCKLRKLCDLPTPGAAGGRTGPRPATRAAGEAAAPGASPPRGGRFAPEASVLLRMKRGQNNSAQRCWRRWRGWTLLPC